MALFTFPAQAVSIPGAATEATLLLVEQNTADTVTELQDVNSELNTQTTTLNSIDGKVLTDTQLRASPVPILASSLPLPTGAATSANQVTANASLASIDTKLTSPITVTGPLTDTELRASAVPVSAASLPLPTGAATEATLSALAAEDFATEATLSALNSKVPANLTVSSTRLLVDGSGVTQPVSAVSLPLPTGAATEATLANVATEATVATLATEATLTTVSTDVASIDGKIPANLTVSSTRLLVDGSGVTQPVSASSLPLPTGAATETTLANVESSLSLDVVDQIDTTPLLNVSSTNIPASAASPLEVVASTAATIRKVVSVEDIGEFIGLYTGPASSEVLKCVLPLGGGEIQVQIPSGTRISLRNMKNATITSGFISLNFLG